MKNRFTETGPKDKTRRYATHPKYEAPHRQHQSPTALAKPRDWDSELLIRFGFSFLNFKGFLNASRRFGPWNPLTATSGSKSVLCFQPPPQRATPWARSRARSGGAQLTSYLYYLHLTLQVKAAQPGVTHRLARASPMVRAGPPEHPVGWRRRDRSFRGGAPVWSHVW